MQLLRFFLALAATAAPASHHVAEQIVEHVREGGCEIALPGSPGACKDAWDEILKWQLDYRHRPCNFVEIMPRLDEHQRRK